METVFSCSERNFEPHLALRIPLIFAVKEPLKNINVSSETEGRVTKGPKYL
jgi:hypothetical protein